MDAFNALHATLISLLLYSTARLASDTWLPW